MKTELAKLRKKISIGIVGGSDMSKQIEQLGEGGENLNYFFSKAV